MAGRPDPDRRPKKTCPVCGHKWFDGAITNAYSSKRTDAMYCSPACRTRAWRERRSRSVDVTR
jgi:hypothetical protein